MESSVYYRFTNYLIISLKQNLDDKQNEKNMKQVDLMQIKFVSSNFFSTSLVSDHIIIDQVGAKHSLQIKYLIQVMSIT